MSMFVQDIRLEALSALSGADIQPLDEFSTRRPITPQEFLILTLFGCAYDLIYNWGALILSKALQSHCQDKDFHDILNEKVHLNERFKEFFVDVDTFFDPKYDFDFTNLPSQPPCTRGGESYRRPIGWYRMALKVKDKYPDGNTWLGPDGWREYSAPGEWPVAFHGTSLDGAKGIIQSHYKAGNGQVYGRGIYSTPLIDSAIAYTKEFTSKTNGKRYRAILQNRINPLKREQCARLDYWLIRVPEHLSSQQERELAESAIRPYGILIQEVTG